MLLPLVAVLLATGCSRATATNYAKIQNGMPRTQVYDILGEPDQIAGGSVGPFSVSSETWEGRKQVINVTFGSDKVAIKSINSRNTSTTSSE